MATIISFLTTTGTLIVVAVIIAPGCAVHNVEFTAAPTARTASLHGGGLSLVLWVPLAPQWIGNSGGSGNVGMGPGTIGAVEAFEVAGCDEVAQETWEEVGEPGLGLEAEPFELPASETQTGDFCDAYGLADSWYEREMP